MGNKTTVSQQLATKGFGKEFPGLKYLLKLVIVFTGYVAVGKLGLLIPFTSGNVSPIWPASGLALAAVLLGGYEVWPGMALGALAVNFFSPIPPISAFAIALGNTSSALFGGYLSRRFGGLQLRLPALHDVLNLILVATVSPIFAASVGSASLYLLHTPTWSNIGTAWRVWWLGGAMGVLIVAPLFLAGREFADLFKLPRLIELFSLAVSIIATCLAIFGV
jgi:integral membrane sensor domain MASE1